MSLIVPTLSTGRTESRSRPFVTAVMLCILGVQLGACDRDTDAVDATGANASAKIDVLFADLTDGIQPGAAVLVIKDGKIVHEAGYGYAKLDTQTPITGNTQFRLASVSKQFTAMAIMVLAEDGKLDFDDPVSRYLPQLAPYQGVSIRNLLTHTGGLPDYYDSIETDPRPTNADALALLGRMASPVFAPGEKYEYSNPGYDMLAPLVEAVSGVEFRDFMKENVFAPAGMNASLIHDHRPPEFSDRALGYDPDGDGYKLDDDDPLNGIVGSGGMYSTLQDFYRWDQALYGDAIVSQSMIQQAFTPMKLNDGESTDYGFAWGIDEYRTHRRVRHGGSWVGFRTHIARYPDDRFTIVILTNRSDANPAQYIDPITDIYLGDDASHAAP